MSVRQELKDFAKRGIRYTFRKTGIDAWYRRDIGVDENGEGRTVVDVLFINGCDLSVPHPPRYRVTHQREQLEAFNITTDEKFYTQVNHVDVKYANAFVIFRCPYTDEIGALISEAHRLHKPVYFDIDDLVIDTKYTDRIPYVQSLYGADKELYDDGVNRMGKTLKLCDGAITTTGALADELKNYVPEVFVNRNTASDEMYYLSRKAITLKEKNKTDKIVLDAGRHIVVPKRTDGEIRIGYFSGSITHNADVEMIMPALANIMHENLFVRLYIVGELDIPETLKEYQKQIVAFPFMDWKLLPSLIALVDINLAPLEDTIFNRAKSENKWVEASLVKTVSVMSDLGAFREMVKDGETGFLCEEGGWEETLNNLIRKPELRNAVAENAYNFVSHHCVTLYSGKRIADFFRSKLQKRVVMILPSTEISGGIKVALQHLNVLYRNGWNITLVASHPSQPEMTFDGVMYPVIYLEKEKVNASYDKGIATMWTTVQFLLDHSNIRQCYYLVQNYETDFYDSESVLRIGANRTYEVHQERFHYVTISRWCQSWLKSHFDQNAEYAPNGIATQDFHWTERNLDEAVQGKRKIRILIEGDSAVSYKGVDDSFRITNALDHHKYEIWYMSYNEGSKKWYHVDRFFHRVPYNEVGKIYEQCDILLKSSILESFSYPPLEMMATGGYVVAVKNGGNQEYLKDGENCLFYPYGDTKAGIQCIEKICQDKELRRHLQMNVKALVESRDWGRLEKDILHLYGQD